MEHDRTVWIMRRSIFQAFQKIPRSIYSSIDGDKDLAFNFHVCVRKVGSQCMAFELFGDFGWITYNNP